MSARARLLAPVLLASLFATLVFGVAPAHGIEAPDASPELIIGAVVSVEPQLVAETGVIVTEVQVVESLTGGGTGVTSFTMQGGEVGDLGMWSEQFTDVQVGDSVVAPVHQSGGETAAVAAPLTGTGVEPLAPGDVETMTDAVAAGYIYDGLHWSDSSLPVRFYVNTSGMPAGSSSAISASAQTWENDAGSYMDFNYEGTTATSPGSGDSVNVVGSGNLGAGGALAVCQIWYNSSTQHITQFDITFNVANHAFGTSGSSSVFDVQSVGTHEFGHTLHLKDMYDAENANQVMYGYVGMGDTSNRALAWGDRAGIGAIYPVRSGALSGTVTNSSGSPLSGVSVSVPGSNPVVTAANGTYAVSDISEGTYDVTFAKAGYLGKTLSVTISEGSTTVGDAVLYTPPVTSLSASPTSALSSWTAGNVTITLSATSSAGAVAWTRYSINGAAEQYYATPFVLTSEGASTVTYRSQDAQGNPETARTATVRIDKSPPVTSAADMRSSYGAGTGASIALVATDTLSGVASTAWRVGTAGAFTAGTSVPVPAAVGTYTVQYYSVDAVGNTEPLKASAFSVVVDSSAPVTTSDAASTYVSSARISLHATDAGSGVASTRWLLDGIAGSGLTVDVPTYGAHTLRFWSVDVVGNAETPTVAAFFVADVTPPVASAYADLAYMSGAAIQLTAADEVNGSGIASVSYRVDDEPTQTVAGASCTVAPSQGATHTVTYWASDVAGNSSAPAAITRRVDGPTRFIITRIPAPTSPGNSVTLSARAETSTAVGPVLGEPVQLQVSRSGVWSQAVPTAELMAADGSFSFVLTPYRSAVYRLVTAPGSTLRLGQSDEFVIGVRATVTRPSAPSSPRARRTFSTSGKVTPVLKRSARLQWYRVKGSSKKFYSAKTISLSSSGKWSAKRSLPKGTWAVRIVYTDPLGVVTKGHFRTFKVR